MDIKEAQNKIKNILGNIEHPRLASFIALTEEVGEVADEVMKREVYNEKENIDDLKAEIADVLVCIFELANVYDFDLNKEFEKKIKDIEPRAKKWELSLIDILRRKREKLD